MARTLVTLVLLVRGLLAVARYSRETLKKLDNQKLKRIVRAPMKKQHDNLIAFLAGSEARIYPCASQLRGIRMTSIIEATMR